MTDKKWTPCDCYPEKIIKDYVDGIDNLREKHRKEILERESYIKFENSRANS